MKKKLRAFDWHSNSGPPLVAVAAAAAPVNVTAHIGLRGDVFGPGGFVDSGSDLQTVQGFEIDVGDKAIEFRVRYPDNSWSDWTLDGRFAGTRGKALPVTGFSVRSREGEQAKYKIRAFGRFVGQPRPAEAGDGEDCVSRSGALLRGLQVELIERG